MEENQGKNTSLSFALTILKSSDHDYCIKNDDSKLTMLLTLREFERRERIPYTAYPYFAKRVFSRFESVTFWSQKSNISTTSWLALTIIIV